MHNKHWTTWITACSTVFSDLLHPCPPCRRAGTIYDCGGGVKIMRATFRGIHKSVINDNEKHSPRLKEYRPNIIMMWIHINISKFTTVVSAFLVCYCSFLTPSSVNDCRGTLDYKGLKWNTTKMLTEFKASSQKHLSGVRNTNSLIRSSMFTDRYFFPTNPGGQNTMLTPQVNFRGVIWPPWPPGSRDPVPVQDLSCGPCLALPQFVHFSVRNKLELF